jgi:hypothetical protein
MPDVRAGRKREEKGFTMAKFALFCALQAQLRSCRNFPPAGLRYMQAGDITSIKPSYYN